MENKKYIKFIAIFLIILFAAGIYFAYRYYVDYTRSFIDPKDVQNQINYSQGTKKLLDNRPFIDKLPYTSTDFDIYYSTVNDEVQIIMKNKGLSFADAQKADQAEVYAFLQSIGVDINIQKIVWLLQQ